MGIGKRFLYQHFDYDFFFQPYTMAKELYIATLKDIQMWNKREMRVGLEWAKTFDLFNQLSLDDRASIYQKLYLDSSVDFSY